jgi:hypothetical protein
MVEQSRVGSFEEADLRTWRQVPLGGSMDLWHYLKSGTQISEWGGCSKETKQWACSLVAKSKAR